MRRLIYIIGVMTVMGLLNGCTSDDERTAATSRLTLYLGAPDYAQTTRALPTGFKSYSELYPQATASLSTIRLFLTTTEMTLPGQLTYAGNNKWTSDIPIDQGQNYNVFGFMPIEDAEGATLTHLDGASDYSSGATMTVSGLDAVTPADICVVVGIKETNATGTEGSPELGAFALTGKAEDNYAFLLLDHLYAGLHFRLKVNEEYNELRTIKLKELKLKANNIKPKVTAVVTLWSRTYAATQSGYDAQKYDPITSATFTGTGEGSYAETTLFPQNNEEPLTLTTEYQDFLGCFAPGTCKDFTLESTYDVYDRKGKNLIRKNQTAENRITFGQDLARGKINKYNMTVNPTYLYMLSEPDLDNPTVDLSE